jgi:hypothetical protein
VEQVRSTPAALLTDGFRAKWGDITDTSVALLGKHPARAAHPLTISCIPKEFCLRFCLCTMLGGA